jgi:hypothetical protein
LIGGGSEVVATHITHVFRGINRMSIIILFMCLLAIGLIVDRTLHAWKGFLVRAVFLTGAILALLDQIPSGIGPNYAQDIAAFRADEDFVRKIESSVTRNAKVFQLPVVWFPAFGGVCQMKDYNHLRGYLHSDRLQWSYGAVPGRSTYRWQLGVADLPASEMVARLAEVGFQGIYINTMGFEDGAQNLINELRRELGSEPIAGGSQGELRFFRLPKSKPMSSTNHSSSRSKSSVGEQSLHHFAGQGLSEAGKRSGARIAPAIRPFRPQKLVSGSLQHADDLDLAISMALEDLALEDIMIHCEPCPNGRRALLTRFPFTAVGQLRLTAAF